MNYVEVGSEIGKSLYFIRKGNKGISEKQMNYFLTYNIVNEIVEEYNPIEPNRFYVCFVVREFVDRIKDKYLGRKGFLVTKFYYFDEKKLLKYIEYHNKKVYSVEEKDCEKDFTCLDNQHNTYSEMFSYFLTNGYNNIIRSKIENNYILNEKELEEVKKLYEYKDVEILNQNEVEFICDNIREYSSSYGYSTTNYIYFYGKYLGRKVVLKVTEKSLRESFKIWDKEYNLDGFIGKKVCIYGKLSFGNGVVKGQRCKVLYFH